LQDANLAELNQWAPRVFDMLKALPELRDVASDQQTNALQLSLEVDRDIASSLGVSLQAVDGTLYDAFGQRQVATMYTQLNQYRVVLEAKPGLAGNRSRSTTCSCTRRTGRWFHSPCSPTGRPHARRFPSVTRTISGDYVVIQLGAGKVTQSGARCHSQR